MVFDIPNYVTLPIELGVAILILLMDRRSRHRENASILRFQEQQKSIRENELKQRERFNNWAQDSSKRQMMLLESIMATLDNSRVDEFKNQVGSRYTKEINQDIADLEELLDKRRKSQINDPELEVDIESKIDEIESGKQFLETFLPSETVSQLNNLANSAKDIYSNLKNIPQTFKFSKERTDPSRPDDKTKNKKETKFAHNNIDNAFTDFKENRVDFSLSLEQFIEDNINTVKDEIKDSLKNDDLYSKFIKDGFDSSKIEKGIKEFVKKIKEEENETDSTKKD